MKRSRALAALHRSDVRLFKRIARSHSPLLDRLLPRLTRAANLSRLWIASAALLALFGGRFGKRAAVRGMTSVGITSAIVNLALKPVFRRTRPSLRLVPGVRRLPTPLTTASFPSGHAASASAFAVGASMELPAAGPLLGVLAGSVAYSRIYTGAHYPGDVLAGCAVGTALALLTSKLVVYADVDGAGPSPAPARLPGAPSGRRR